MTTKNNQIDRIAVAVKNIDHICRLASEILESDDELHLVLLSDRTRVSDNEYVENLDREQILKLSISFDIKRYLKNI